MMACHGCHQPADYDARPPRSREHPWSCERQTHVFWIAMLFAVETSSPAQRARKWAWFSTNGGARSFASWASLLHASASQSQQGPTWPPGRLGRIYRGMPNPWLGPDRPLTPDSIPSRRNGRPHGANPNAVSDRVPGSAPGLARIGDDIFEQQMHSKG